MDLVTLNNKGVHFNKDVPTTSVKVEKEVQNKSEHLKPKNRRKKRQPKNRTNLNQPLSDVVDINKSFNNLKLQDDQARKTDYSKLTKQRTKQNSAHHSNEKHKTIKYTFQISAVQLPAKYQFFKCRNVKSGFISLSSYVGTSGTCIFTTSSSITSSNTSSQNNKKGKCPRVKGHQSKHETNKKRHAKHHHSKSTAEFPKYMTEKDVKEGLQDGDLIKGYIRINQKSAQHSFVSNADSTLPDFYINSITDRNRALEGDEVVLNLKPESEWVDHQKTAIVVHILNKIHPRIGVGTLKPLGRNNEYAEFHPRDKRLPIVHIPSISWPNQFATKPQFFSNILVSVKITEWNVPEYAVGIVLDCIGTSGNLKAETISILTEFGLDITPFSMAEIQQYLPKSEDIPVEELKFREDIRKDCVFTIDPLTARDLDDAVSVKRLSNGHYEVGVHISDASFYLHEGTSLDDIVSKKATTIYLVDNVYHMLPVDLCLHCSLLPGNDKLAFSVFWEMNEVGDIFNTRFARTIVNSCAKLAYEHAQQIIDNPKKKFTTEDLPLIYNGFSPEDICWTVSVLQNIAIKLRETRKIRGALRIDQLKLLFSLNPATGEPLDFIAYESKESHRLIEEFMLLANISVAEQIHKTFPEIAFLRCHEPPKYTMLLEAKRCLETFNIDIDISSSGSISTCLEKYITNDYAGFCRGIVLNHIFSKPMNRARYFCASTIEDESGFSHYALHVPMYTHFTSPIRRYADIMVHRLLAASLGYAEKPKWNLDHVERIANICNIKKYNAKRAGEVSSNLYLTHYVSKHEPYIQDCVVVDVKDKSFDVIVIKTGSVVRVYQNKCQDNPAWKVEVIDFKTTSNDEKINPKKRLKLRLQYTKNKIYPKEQIVFIEMFSVVQVKLRKMSNLPQLETYLLRPPSEDTKLQSTHI